MISFNLGETMAFNIGVDLFSCAITLIILRAYRNSFSDTYDSRLLSRIERFILLALATDILMWLLNGRSGQVLRVLGYADNMVYFITQLIVIHLWIRYAWYRIQRRDMRRRTERLAVVLPFSALALIVLVSPATGWCFYLDEDNFYHRGMLSALMSVSVLAYLFAVSVAALLKVRDEVLVDRKRELQTIAFFAVPPILGGTAQVVFYGLSLVWPCTVLSCLLIFLNRGNQAISQNPLTGLNNRRNMEKQFRMFEYEKRDRPVTLIMMDVNDFKKINDRFGHSCGDEALIRTADVLRQIFNGTPAFLARYGGDEFVVLTPDSDAAAAAEAVCRIKEGVRRISAAEDLPCPVSVSAGYAISAGGTAGRIESLFREADRSMYLDKEQYRREKAK